VPVGACSRQRSRVGTPTPKSCATTCSAALSGASNRANALSLNACPYRAIFVLHRRPSGCSIEAITILTYGAVEVQKKEVSYLLAGVYLVKGEKMLAFHGEGLVAELTEKVKNLVRVIAEPGGLIAQDLRKKELQVAREAGAAYTKHQQFRGLYVALDEIDRLAQCGRKFFKGAHLLLDALIVGAATDLDNLGVARFFGVVKEV